MNRKSTGNKRGHLLRASLFGALLSASGYAAALPSFPGAVGFGSDTPGGRGGKVIEVTNLNDSGAGSLRAALQDATGPRIVVFRTGGTIKLSSVIQVTSPYVTIAGQTAPGDGITLRGAAIRIATHDVIMRGIRIRIGDSPDGPAPDNRDAMQIEGHFSNVIIDHCSFSWSIDETLTFYGVGNHDGTLSNSIMSEALMNSIHPKGGHSKGSLSGPGTDRITYVGNLFAHNDERNPKIRANTAVAVNNVVYNRGFKDLDIEFSGTGDPQKISVEGNLFIKGADSGSTGSIYIRDGLVSGTKIYLHDNDCSSYGGRWPNCVQMENAGSSTQQNSLVNSRPVWNDGLVALPASETLDSVLKNAGANPKNRDAVDARVIASVKNHTGRIIDSQADVGGWPDLKPGTPPPDADHDGMPDEWETAKGLDPNNASDGNKDRDGDGYTNVEEYLNSYYSGVAVAGNPPAAPEIRVF